MNLHEKENVAILAEAVRLTAAEFNVPQSYVEKDYFLTNALLKLSQFEYSDNIVFKGGTSLSKIYRAIYRFSEDIDLAILPDETWKNAKIKRVIKAAIKSASHGLEDSGIKFNNGSKFRKERYNFPRINSSEALGEVQDSILFECNAYTTPSPAIKKDVRSLIAEWAIRNDKADFIDKHNLHDFKIQVLCWKRTYCEKILGLMAAYSRNDLSDKVRHFYDLVVLYRKDDIKDFVASDSEFYSMMSITVQNDIDHAGRYDLPWIQEDISKNGPFSEFDVAWAQVEPAYNGDFQAMVTRQELNPEKKEIFEVFNVLKLRLESYSKSSLHLACLATMS
ncbi:TPA: nucleotidyl transferase AbiEii/AbiGii toxin family protein [Vibrio parahaemolyticus]|nr:nucleotidyl transferase AbiEii/AbiGii toxin family protein [Vibrio parahaemolyticus]